MKFCFNGVSNCGEKPDYEGSNHVVKLSDETRQPDYKGFILTIPQSEFDGNINMDPIADQNPL